MQRWVMGVLVIGLLSTAGVAAAFEREGGAGGEMPPAIRAIKEKYQARREQIHNECRQKMEALEQEERNEFQAAMKTAHDQQMQKMEQKYQQRTQEMHKRWDERRQNMEKKHE